jgi:hypothetical protein
MFFKTFRIGHPEPCVSKKLEDYDTLDLNLQLIKVETQIQCEQAQGGKKVS